MASGETSSYREEGQCSDGHYKHETIWHTTVPRTEQELRSSLGYPMDSFKSKKRRVSSGIEIVKCHICGFHFDSPAQLSDHLLDHDQDYRFAPIYKCSYGQCMFKTDDRSTMKHHISRIHLRTEQALISKKHRTRRLLRPTILCGTCPMVFATEKELWNHTPTCKDHRCQFCGKHFWTVEKRYLHEEIYHEDEFEDEDGMGQEQYYEDDNIDRRPADSEFPASSNLPCEGDLPHGAASSSSTADPTPRTPSPPSSPPPSPPGGSKSHSPSSPPPPPAIKLENRNYGKGRAINRVRDSLPTCSSTSDDPAGAPPAAITPPRSEGVSPPVQSDGESGANPGLTLEMDDRRGNQAVLGDTGVDDGDIVTPRAPLQPLRIVNAEEEEGEKVAELTDPSASVLSSDPSVLSSTPMTTSPQKIEIIIASATNATEEKIVADVIAPTAVDVVPAVIQPRVTAIGLHDNAGHHNNTGHHVTTSADTCDDEGDADTPVSSEASVKQIKNDILLGGNTDSCNSGISTNRSNENNPPNANVEENTK